MWYKVRELSKQGLSKSQISRETGLDRATIRKYLKMSEENFQKWDTPSGTQGRKLSEYISFVKKELEIFPDLSAAQIEDHLKEYFTDLPEFHSKTVYNFVQFVRQKYDIPKPKNKGGRIFEKLVETDYGDQAQVDFGETWMQTIEGKRRKVYFFAIVLSRSRYKFVYLVNKPFTASVSVHAHEQAFDYFEGVPKEIIYDQDSVFIHDENLGDYLLTKDFHQFCQSQDFKPIFCRRSDPQSKGKVENVVKYVKQNFLRGRKYIDIDALNTSAIEWLNRTGNAKTHSTTQRIPFEEWEKEKKFLLPLKKKSVEAKSLLQSYKARKDNTIAYQGNFYSLPSGTYKNSGTSILLEVKHEELFIYTTDKELITSHKIGVTKGEFIRNTDHVRLKSESTQENRKKTVEILGASPTTDLFLDLLQKDKPRYFRDNLQFIINKIKNYPSEIIHQSLVFCIDNKQFNASVLLQVINSKFIAGKKEKEAEVMLKSLTAPEVVTEKEADNEIQISKIDNYEKIFERCQN